MKHGITIDTCKVLTTYSKSGRFVLISRAIVHQYLKYVRDCFS